MSCWKAIHGTSQLGKNHSSSLSKYSWSKKENYIDKMNLFLSQMPRGRKSKIQVKGVRNSFSSSSLWPAGPWLCPRRTSQLPPGTAHLQSEAVHSSVQRCPWSRHKDRQQGRVERRTSSEQGSRRMNAGLKAQSSNLLISQSWHKQQQLKTVPLVCPLAACRSSPAECQAIMCGWLWRTSKLAWGRRQESNGMEMTVYWEGERRLVFPLPSLLDSTLFH